ncbi:BREX-1 system adenine-specific DNA-methyltransferase PglX [Ruania zhangjianzhongii]|uniref:BREX-1 system adenine-specific DNA-methyltransferase PglX n=1 Tax=Ruania zhangjianzhongii TaxID=2603206 RepID=UPI0011C820EF|nr:BREX-1 system adenine-specific DNA-methyltransferase PglX [Ruania zhangjianzhongii]
METAPLKNFATWARTALIREVSARIAAVLAPGSSERIEQAKAVTALEKAVAAAGGGEKGRAAVADKVAYTWFNRIIALRFMDANGYTGIGVVSPQAGIEVGQPEVLAEAKRGVVDPEIVSDATRKTVVALLDGSRGSGDPQGEAYALLLEAYCNHWHKAMPFMFEREGDFTELLIPANLLADDSVPNRAVKVLTADVCQDVEVIGWLYQFYISERKDEVFAGFKKNKKAGANEIPAATQLFTPHWIVRYLVENSLGRLWMLNRPSSDLQSQMDYYIAPVDEETDFLRISKPEELKVIDPACGSGHMLTYAFDLLYSIYEEEGYAPSEIPGLILTHNLYGTEIDPRAGALAAFALTMKSTARRKLFLKNPVEPNVCVLDPIAFTPDELNFLVTEDGDKHAEEAFWNQFEHADTFGSLIRPENELTLRLKAHIGRLDDGGDLLLADALEWAQRVVEQAEYLSRAYCVVVTNPPYMGNGNMDDRLSDFAKERYPDSKADLFAMFIQRSFEMLEAKGYSALVTMESWMFLRAYKDLRELIVTSKAIAAMVHMPYLGKGGTPMGINFGTAATVIANRKAGESAGSFQCVRYYETDPFGVPLTFPVRNERLSEVDPRKFLEIPGMPIAYWVSDTFRCAFSAESLSAHFVTRLGMSTANNDRFLRLWPEVSLSDLKLDAASRQDALESGRRWYPYQKGGDFRKWYGNLEFAVNWASDGKEIRGFADEKAGRIRSHNYNLDHIFRQGITWSDFTSAVNAFRFMPAGQLFDGRGSAGFADSEEDLHLILGILNSRVSNEAISAINPTIAINVGEVARLPFPKLDHDDRKTVIANVAQLVELHRSDWDSSERSVGFARSPLAGVDGTLASRVASLVADGVVATAQAKQLEEMNNRLLASAYGLDGEIEPDVASVHITLSANPSFRFPKTAASEAEGLLARELVRDLVSYAVGCMFGRYSLDEPGLILADQGATMQDYLAKVPSPTFMPDADNVIPIVDGDWFEDDIAERFRQFLRAAFGEQHFEENLRFVTESLGVKSLRAYFVKSFYKDHVQRYKKRPIYWLFSSPKGSFNALIYMHRYTPATVSTVLNEYLREFQAKLRASMEHAERANNAKEAERLRKVLLELEEYEHDVLYPLASQNIEIDLDDGVKANYPKFGAALNDAPKLGGR